MCSPGPLNADPLELGNDLRVLRAFAGDLHADGNELESTRWRQLAAGDRAVHDYTVGSFTVESTVKIERAADGDSLCCKWFLWRVARFPTEFLLTGFGLALCGEYKPRHRNEN